MPSSDWTMKVMVWVKELGWQSSVLRRLVARYERFGELWGQWCGFFKTFPNLSFFRTSLVQRDARTFVQMIYAENKWSYDSVPYYFIKPRFLWIGNFWWIIGLMGQSAGGALCAKVGLSIQVPMHYKINLICRSKIGWILNQFCTGGLIKGLCGLIHHSHPNTTRLRCRIQTKRFSSLKDPVWFFSHFKHCW